jgi:archaemetzincin
MIYVVPINNPIAGVVDHIMERLPAVFATQVEVRDPDFHADDAFNDTRHQYNSTILLAQLMSGSPSPASKVIGITNVDLYIPVLTFVFGEAQLGGTVAIVSSHRLRNAFYGLPEDRELLLERLEKEVIHELGHTYNLTHCRDFNCVMYSSSSVGAIDVKGADFCAECRRRLELPKR